MVEYGHAVGEVTGQAGGGAGTAGRSADLGASLGQIVTDSMATLSTMSAEQLLAGFVVVVLGLLILKRAF